MKIVLTNYTAFPFHGYGGAERYIYSLAKELVKQGHEVNILTLRYNKFHENKIIYDGINYIFFSIPFYGVFEINNDFVGIRKRVATQKITKLQKIYGRINYWIAITKWVRSNDYDILHSFSDSGYGFALKQIKQIATVFDIGNRNLRFLPGLCLPVSKADYYSHTTTKILKGANIVTSGGPDNSIELNRIFLVDNKKIAYLHNAIDLDNIKELNFEEKCVVKKKLGFPAKSRIISIFGRLEKNKNPLFAIDLFCDLSQHVDEDIRLLVIGDGSLSDDVDKKIDRINKDHNEAKAQRISNLPDALMNEILQVNDLLLNFAETRYMLLIVMEAMANGAAVVSSQTLDGIVSHDTNGLLVGGKSHDECIRCITNLITNDTRLDAFKKASLEIISTYSWQNTAAQAIEIYNRFLLVQNK